MSKLLIKLTPLEPYFLGGERIHVIGDSNKHYFIRSLETPAQTVLFGVLRYLMIENPGSRKAFNNEYRTAKGKLESEELRKKFLGYALNRPGPEGAFGHIEGISPLYLMDGDGNYYVPLPFDHRVKCTCGEVKNPVYAPFSQWAPPVQTGGGERTLPLDYNAKDGLARGWLRLGDKTVHTDLFESVPQVGIDKYNDDKAFFKKEYKQLTADYSFVFFANVGGDCKVYSRLVSIGQGKASFRAEVLSDEEEPCFPQELISPGAVYAQSDIYISGQAITDVAALYNKCKFVCAQTRPHRLFKENYLDRKDSSTTQLIQAGSVFYPNNPQEFADAIHNSHAELAGFNKIIIGGNTK